MKEILLHAVYFGAAFVLLLAAAAICRSGAVP